MAHYTNRITWIRRTAWAFTAAQLRLIALLAVSVFFAPPGWAGAAPKVERVLLVGDSAMQAGLGTALERELEQVGRAKVLRFAQQATGLCRPDKFDWEKKLPQLMADFHPQLAIAEWGNNDNQALFGTNGKVLAKFGTPEWDKAYAARVSRAVKLLSEGGCAVVVLGLPNMRDRQTANQALRINKVLAEAVAGAGGTYLPTWELTTGPDGKYLPAIEWNGKTRAMREGDGVHLSAHGAGYVAAKLLPKLAQLFTFPGK